MVGLSGAVVWWVGWRAVWCYCVAVCFRFVVLIRFWCGLVCIDWMWLVLGFWVGWCGWFGLLGWWCLFCGVDTSCKPVGCCV